MTTEIIIPYTTDAMIPQAKVDALLVAAAAAAAASSLSTVVLLVLLVLLVSVVLVSVALVSSEVLFEEIATSSTMAGAWVGAFVTFGALVPFVGALVASFGSLVFVVLSFKILVLLRAILTALVPFTEAGTAPEDSFTRRSAKRARERKVLENMLVL